FSHSSIAGHQNSSSRSYTKQPGLQVLHKEPFRSPSLGIAEQSQTSVGAKLALEELEDHETAPSHLVELQVSYSQK
ncbi:hypothetical protein, partial [Salmonella sp. s58760]|uniref:hypothetical protein n=1 Tax=Salmonella sp. s58760 TaxID=3159708 RepID=UPI00397F2F82